MTRFARPCPMRASRQRWQPLAVHSRRARGLRLPAWCLCLHVFAACILPDVSQRTAGEDAAVALQEASRMQPSDSMAKPVAVPPAAGFSAASSGTAGLAQSIGPIAGATASAAAGQSGAAAMETQQPGMSTALAALGAACPASGQSQCESGKCVDGVCCGVGSCDTCYRCGSSGTCEAVRDAMDDSCRYGAHCDAQAKCVSGNGSTCDSGSECASGACVDEDVLRRNLW